jgi:hypothetical protein|tara:strand:- start:86 stop:556 length:471 start_codon:yes stop_codon:yes gene_type:complete
MGHLSAADWQHYKDAINLAHSDFNQETLTWKRAEVFMSRYGEDPTGAGASFVDVPLKVLIQSNYFRSWPVTKTSESGELDKESLVVILNYKYLQNSGYITPNKYFDFKPDLDRFVVKGREYKAFGDLDAAYANDEPLLFYLILKREQTHTGSPINP